MARSTSFATVCFVVLAFALGLAQGAYWTEPNVSPCSMSSMVCTIPNDGCVGWTLNKQNVPSTLDSSYLFVQRLSVPAGHSFLFKSVNMFYTQKSSAQMNWQLLDILNFTVNVWNASADNPDRPLNWSKPIVMWQRVQVTRGPSGEMFLAAFRAQANLSSQPIALSAGEYMFAINGYSGANPATYTASLDQFMFWFQTPEMNPSYADDSWIVYSGSNMANMYNPLPVTSNNGSTWWVTTPGRLCTWAVGALTNLSDGTVTDPTVNTTLNTAGYIVRYFFRQDISEFNVSQFIANMNDRLNVASISPFARVVVYNITRMYECISVDWFVTSTRGYIAMAQGYSFNISTIASATGLVPNNIPGRVYGAYRDT